MASNFENKTGAGLDWQSVIEYLLTTDRVLGDPADIVGAVGGKINVVLQQIIDNLNWLREKGLVDATTTVKGLVELANIAEGRAGSAQNVVPPVNVVRDMINEHAPTPGPSGISESRANQLINAAIAAALVSATTDRQGLVELATEAEANNENENTKALTAASLYRSINLTEGFQLQGIHSGLRNLRITDISSTISAKYFGPILIYSSTGTITIRLSFTALVGSGNKVFYINHNFQDLSTINWTESEVGISSVVVEGTRVKVSVSGVTGNSGSFTIRGTKT